MTETKAYEQSPPKKWFFRADTF